MADDNRWLHVDQDDVRRASRYRARGVAGQKGGPEHEGLEDPIGLEASGSSLIANEGRGFGYGSDYRQTYGGSVHGGGDRGGRGYGSRVNNDRGMFERTADEIASWFGDEGAVARRQEDHRGRGPKGYRRTDERILDDVNERLTEDPIVDAREITVDVAGGEVTLTGFVPDRQSRRRAEDIVEAVSGVGHVQNSLRVGRPAEGTGQGALKTGDEEWAPDPRNIVDIA